jgi:hypothetical protein
MVELVAPVVVELVVQELLVLAPMELRTLVLEVEEQSLEHLEMVVLEL